MSEEEATRALVREVGRRSVERLGDGLTRVAGEATALYRWLLTMLLLMNGAGIYLSIAARGAIGPALFGQVTLIFFGGAMAAILAALVSMVLTLPAAAALRKAITHWTDVSVSGELSPEALVSARQVKWTGTIWLALTSLAVLVSLTLFVVGADRLATHFGVLKEEAEEAVAPLPAPEPPFPNAAHSTAQSNEAAGALATPAPTPTGMPSPTPTARARSQHAAPKLQPQPPAQPTPPARPTPTVRSTPTPASRPNMPSAPVSTPSPAASQPAAPTTP
ncbi:hypothetical protein KK488_02945 [Sphingobium sp. H33]|uniref:Uncharacterized protein n=2 Tax=Sphingobium nicotianae TaxID=2782607 RepID=A0A9X1AKA1_9SPHN|nr:hypothetical protein [Sphingobium nicotianae]